MNHLYHISSCPEPDLLLDTLKKSERISFQPYRRHSFDNGNFLIEILDSQSKPSQVYISFFNHYSTEPLLFELGLLVNTLKREYGCPIKCFVRYLEYSRSNRVNQKNISFGAKLYINLLCGLDIDQFVVFDLHAPELLGFFSKPISQVSSLPLFINYFHTIGLRFDYIVAPDCGRVDDCYYLSTHLDAKMDFFPKIRRRHGGASEIITKDRVHLKGKTILLFDDEITSGQTLQHAIESLIYNEVNEIHIAVVYMFCKPEIFKVLERYPQVRSFTTTNLGAPLSFRDDEGKIAYHILNCSSLFEYK